MELPTVFSSTLEVFHVRFGVLLGCVYVVLVGIFVFCFFCLFVSIILLLLDTGDLGFFPNTTYDTLNWIENTNNVFDHCEISISGGAEDEGTIQN